MAEPLKNMFSKKFYVNLAELFYRVDKKFNRAKFVSDVTKNMEEMSLNQRMRNTSVVLKRYLPEDYKSAIEIMKDVVPQLDYRYTSLIFPDFVGQYGHDHFQISMDALKYFTQFGSSEFAIREFLKRDFKKTIAVMKKWATDENIHVRRLASEGSRPRLPWSFNLDEVIKNPELTRPILEALKADKEVYVKKSVANHLNDFSRINPEWMLKLIHSWDRNNKDTAWIIKRASRTLIKKGDAHTLHMLDFEKNVKAVIKKFTIQKTIVHLGETQIFSFDLISEKSTSQKLAIDFVVHYKKKLGNSSPKVFKLKEVDLQPNQTICLTKSIRITDFTTRKHHPGKHIIEIMINGKIMGKKEFELVV
jgi:3-methyladenine DNA glycosylase AlkC